MNGHELVIRTQILFRTSQGPYQVNVWYNDPSKV